MGVFKKVGDIFNKRAKWIFVAVLILSGILTFGNTLKNEMFWDDNDFILNNRYIKDWKYLPEIFSENVIAGSLLHSNYWRPVLLLVFSLEWRMWEGAPMGYHAVNMGFHILAGVILFLFLENLLRSRSLAFLSVLLFIIHPLQTEAVSYANSLGDSLSAFFMFFGLYLFLSSTKNKSSASAILQTGSILAFVFGLMSKETAIIMPVFIFLADFFKPEEGAQKNMWQKAYSALLSSAPYFLLAGVYVFLRAGVLNFGGTFNLYQEENIFSGSIIVRIFTFFKIFLTYLGLIFFPNNLHMERTVDFATGFLNKEVIAGAMLFAILFFSGFRNIKKRKEISFGIFWFMTALIPTSNIFVPINGLLYEHWLYVPMVGFAIFIFSIGNFLTEKFFSKIKYHKTIIGIFLVMLFASLCALTMRRNLVWRDAVRFYEDVLKYSPRNYRIINNLGMELAERDRHTEAEAKYREAIEIDMKNAVAWHNLGNLQAATGKYKEATKSYETALSLQSDFFFSVEPLFRLYNFLGENDKAQDLINKYQK